MMVSSKAEPKRPDEERVRERRYEILGVYFLALGVLALLSLLLSSPGTLGEVARDAIWASLGTVGGFLAPFVFLVIGWHLLRWRRGMRLSARIMALSLAAVAFLGTVSFFDASYLDGPTRGGYAGRFLYGTGERWLSRAGAGIVFAALFLTSLILVLDKPLTALIGSWFSSIRGRRAKPPRLIVRPERPPARVGCEPSMSHDGSRIIRQIADGDEPVSSQVIPVGIPPVPQTPPAASPVTKGGKPGDSSRAPQLRLDMPPGRHEVPSLGVLDPVVQRPRKPGKVAAQAKQLEETLANFGVSARVVEIHSGPAVTRYDIQPAPGVKVSRIAGLSDDLALALAARGLRIEAPIPGKAAVGIEVPNSEVTVVSMREVLESPEFQAVKSRLKVALGKDIAGETVVTELPRLPHLLIAGATGSGKSVCINTLLASILFTAGPDEVKLILIDPKRVELAGYNDIPHLLSPVVTEPKKAAAVLKQVVYEMENRYKVFAAAGARDIERYNSSAEPANRKPSIVVIIDELADLMMVAPADVEESICRLAQMARATGIHLVVATQRPSVDVITGLIKANIPSRIAFAVSSQIDSRTILDSTGAEKLLGRGDMLFAPVGALKPFRVQGAYISDREIERLVAFWRSQGRPSFDENIVNAEHEDAEYDDGEDDLFYDALRVVVDAGQASASLLQRKLRIGYSRAGRLIDMMESRGLVGGADGSRAREVLINGRQLEELRNRRASAP